MKRTKVLIVDDSALIQRVLSEILSSDPDIEVVGTASDPHIARSKIKELNPDVITLDVEMPRMDGISFLERLMRLRPMPVVMISAITRKGAFTTLKALELGAVDFISKPSIGSSHELTEYATEIISKVKNAAKVEIQRLHKVSSRETSVTKSDNKPAVEPSYPATVILQKSNSHSVPKIRESVIAIGASTGGTEAVRRILEFMPADSPPILIAQHIPPVFSASFAQRLNDLSAMTVVEAVDGQKIQRGFAYVAPGSRHLMLAGEAGAIHCRLSDGPPVNRYKPSVDVLFRSFATLAGKNAIGVILTGMGADGALGMEEMHDTGAQTIAQDEKTSIVWGMPGKAVDRGAVMHVLPIQAIASKLIQLTTDR